MRFKFIKREPGRWRPWFAWHPVVIGTQWVWLELIWRQWWCSMYDDGYKYSLTKNPLDDEFEVWRKSFIKGHSPLSVPEKTP